MALPSRPAGARRPPLTVTWMREGTTTPEDLTGATITGVLRRSGTNTAITGTLTVTDGTGGVFRWDFSAADVATAGTYEVQFNAAFGSGLTPAKTFVAQMTITRSLA